MKKCGTANYTFLKGLKHHCTNVIIISTLNVKTTVPSLYSN